jgi:hypothetical protein
MDPDHRGEEENHLEHDLENTPIERVVGPDGNEKHLVRHLLVRAVGVSEAGIGPCKLKEACPVCTAAVC